MTVRTRLKPSSLVVSSPSVLPSYDCLIVTTNMLPSVNRKYGRGKGNRLFIRKTYRRLEEAAIEDLENQLLVQNSLRKEQGLPLWVPRTTDRYLVLYDFQFAGNLREDIHNPLKPTCDLLKKAGLIFEDNRVFQEFLEKFPKMPYPTARITIYRVGEKDYQPVPTHSLVESWFTSHYQLAV